MIDDEKKAEGGQKRDPEKEEIKAEEPNNGKANQKSRAEEKVENKEIEKDSLTADAAPKELVVSAQDVISGIIGLVHRIGFEDKSSVCKAGKRSFAFVLTESAINKISQYANERLRMLESLPKESITFVGEVAYSDSTSDRFPSLEELLKHAGDKKSPMYLRLQWKCLLAKPPLMMASVCVEFYTDKRMETESLDLFSFPTAHMDYAIAGVDRDWVEGTTACIVPILDSIRVKGLYKPLLIFRNSTIVQVTGWMIALLTAVMTIQVLLRRFQGESNAETLRKILEDSTIKDKFDTYARYLFSETSLVEPLIIAGAGLLLVMVTLVLSYRLLPKLVPRSGILIGLETQRFQEYQNVFKFIIFTILFGGLGVALLIELIKFLF